MSDEPVYYTFKPVEEAVMQICSEQNRVRRGHRKAMAYAAIYSGNPKAKAMCPVYEDEIK